MVRTTIPIGRAILTFVASDDMPRANATEYIQVSGGYTTWSVAEAAREQIIPIGGIINRLFVRTSTPPLVGESWIFTLRLNGIDTALTVTIAGAVQTEGNDVVNNVEIEAGDVISMECIGSLGVAAGYCTFAVMFTA